MNCEHATQLLCARLDGELAGDDRDALESHLERCDDCTATADAFALQDAALRDTFAPRRDAAAALAERVSRHTPKPTPRPRGLWALPAAMTALAAGIAVAIFLRLPDRPTSVARSADPVRSAGLVPKPRPKPPELTRLAVGGKLETKAGERQRVALPDASVLYVNQSTSVTLTDRRRIDLERGEVFVEVAKDAGAFLVHTPTREVTATGTKFAVRSAAAGTSVVVAQGTVEVSGIAGALTAGQQLAFGDIAASSSPRASHEIEWTRELMAAAESPLVPASKYAGGSLVAVDPYGEQAKLSLRKYHIDVHIEDGFARTTIDQTFFNAENFQLEGTFYFPLPPDAQLSRLAMYVNGDLMEGGMAERDFARQTYERIRYAHRDPALLEWVDGSVFKMRVFPLEPRQEKRIVLGYTQKLPSLYGSTSYRFPGGHTMGTVGEWSFSGRIRNANGVIAVSPTHPNMTVRREGGDIVLSDNAKSIKPDADVVVELTRPAGESVRWSGVTHDGHRYLMLRYRPELPSRAVRERRDWVFVFESSGARDALVARVQADIVKTLLQNAEHGDTFALLTAGTRVRALSPERLPVTPSNVERAAAFLDSTHLIGAMNVQNALTESSSFIQDAANPHLVFVGSGVASLGEQKAENLAKLAPSPAKFVGVAVGKRWSRPFLKGAAEATGGYFTQINPDESVAWRGFELAATLNTPRLLNVEVESGAKFLAFGNAVAQGEEIAAVTRLEAGKPLPASLTVRGTLDGQSFERVIPVLKVADDAGYLPRAWAKLELDRMIAADEKRDDIVKLSKEMYVMTPYTSLLVLENEAMYREFKVDRGRKDHWAMYPCPAKVPVVYEPDPNHPLTLEDAKKLAAATKPHENVVRQSLIVRQPAPVLAWPGRNQDNNPDRTAGTLGDQEKTALGRTKLFVQNGREALSDKRGKDRLFFDTYDSSPRGTEYLLALQDADGEAVV